MYTIKVFNEDIPLLSNYILQVNAGTDRILVSHKVSVSRRLLEFCVCRNGVAVIREKYSFFLPAHSITPLSFVFGDYYFSCDEFFNWRIDHYTPSSIPTPESPL